MRTGIAFLLGAATATLFFLSYQQISGPEKGRFGDIEIIAPSTSEVRLARQNAQPSAKEFHWSSVESPDYRIYIDNLRRIGCPEKTIKDIVVADVDTTFESKERPLRILLSRKPYWRSANSEPEYNGAIEDAKQKLKDVIAEKHEILKALLGENVVRDLGQDYEYETIVASTDGPLGFLPPEKQSKVMRFRSEFEALLRGYFPESPTTPDETKAYLEMKENFHNQLKGVLSEEESRMYKLQTSPETSWIRYKYGDLNLTEEEFVSLHGFLKQYESEVDPFLGRKPGAAKRTSEIFDTLEKQVREMVGKERYDRFLASRNFITIPR